MDAAARAGALSIRAEPQEPAALAHSRARRPRTAVCCLAGRLFALALGFGRWRLARRAEL